MAGSADSRPGLKATLGPQIRREWPPARSSLDRRAGGPQVGAFEWHARSKLAAELGVPQATIDAIGGGKVPTTLTDDERLLHGFCIEALHAKESTSPTRLRGLARAFRRGHTARRAVHGRLFRLRLGHPERDQGIDARRERLVDAARSVADTSTPRRHHLFRGGTVNSLNGLRLTRGETRWPVHALAENNAVHRSASRYSAHTPSNEGKTTT